MISIICIICIRRYLIWIGGPTIISDVCICRPTHISNCRPERVDYYIIYLTRAEI